MENTIQFEEWRPIVSYEGLYEVSSFGRVRSLDHYANYKSKGKRLVKGRILKQSTVYGYKQATLCKNGKCKTFRVHRLVAQAFIPNPDNLPEVNHKSECRAFNHFSTLEWCDHNYNNNFGDRVQRISQTQINDKKKSKCVCQYTIDGEFVRKWLSVNEIQRVLGYSAGNICSCCLNRTKYKTAYGFKWCYDDNNKEIA